VSKRLKSFGLKATLVAKNIGYELRCADPAPPTWSTTGLATAPPASSSGGDRVMISMQGGLIAVPSPSESISPGAPRCACRRALHALCDRPAVYLRAVMT
jgi:6-phosphofructokinase 1